MQSAKTDRTIGLTDLCLLTIAACHSLTRALPAHPAAKPIGQIIGLVSNGAVLRHAAGRALPAALIVSVGMATAAADSTASGEFTLQEIMPPLQVSSSQKIAQQTPIANHDGSVYVVNIEPGESGDEDGINLHTVIRHAQADASGRWSWAQQILDTNTIYDPWHTSPAVGVDGAGFIHVAYNMHNLPWQYSRSDQPDSIDGFSFLGEEVTLEEIRKAKFHNKTSFKKMGYASIPGNQITYPAFYSDSKNALYVTYRFAAKPAREFESRTMSAAVAKHDSDTGQWQSLGGTLHTQRGDYEKSWLRKDAAPLAIAAQTGWTAYHPRLAFDDTNRAYVLFYWREGVAGETLIKPCIITSVDLRVFTSMEGEAIQLPVKPQDCSNIPTEVAAEDTYNTIGSITADTQGSVHVLVSPVDRPRRILTYAKGVWSSEESPDGATEIFVDQQDNLWAISSGLDIFRKSHSDKHWHSIVETAEENYCYPKVSMNEDKSKAYIYSQSCDDSNTVTVHALELFPPAEP